MLANVDEWTSIMVDELKKKHSHNEKTYKVARAFKPVKVPAVILVMPLPYKYLYVQIYRE